MTSTLLHLGFDRITLWVQLDFSPTRARILQETIKADFRKSGVSEWVAKSTLYSVLDGSRGMTGSIEIWNRGQVEHSKGDMCALHVQDVHFIRRPLSCLKSLIWSSNTCSGVSFPVIEFASHNAQCARLVLRAFKKRYYSDIKSNSPIRWKLQCPLSRIVVSHSVSWKWALNYHVLSTFYTDCSPFFIKHSLNFVFHDWALFAGQSTLLTWSY